MKKSDARSAFGLAVLIIGLVISLTTGFLEAIIVPVGLTIFGFLALGACYGFVFYLRSYTDNHPYIPYAGRWAHVLCKECMRHDLESRIEIQVGSAFEGWSRAGRYFRGFRREYRATCDRGHSWTFDPILERNVLDKKARQPRHKKSAKAKLFERMKMKAEREAFHRYVFGEAKESA